MREGGKTMRDVGQSRGRTTPRSARQRLAVLVSAALVAAPMVAACSAEGGKTINVYYAPEENFQKVVDDCNAAAQGRYTIQYRKLPREADGQREQMVRRLAAGDDDLDILGLDVTWVAEFAKAGWLVEWTDANKQAAETGVLEAPLVHGQVRRKALRGNEEHEHPAALVRRPGHPGTAEDLGRHDRHVAEAQVRGQAVPDPVDRSAVRGPRGRLQHDGRLGGREDPLRPTAPRS